MQCKYSFFFFFEESVTYITVCTGCDPDPNLQKLGAFSAFCQHFEVEISLHCTWGPDDESPFTY